MTNVKYLIYEYAAIENWLGVKPLKRAPKFEWYIPREDRQRPVYRWGQSELFTHAGEPMPPPMLRIVELIKDEFGEDVNHAIAIDYADGNEQHAPPHKDKAKGVAVKPGTPLDMAEDGSFFVFSFLHPRAFTLQRSKETKKAERNVVWEKALSDGSCLRISAEDNRQFYHAVYRAGKRAGRRISLIFRKIDTHMPIDAARQSQVNSQ